MKHIIALATFLFTCFAHAAGIQTTNPVIDSERAAADFVTHSESYYKGNYYLEQTLLDGSYNWLYGRFTLQDGRITQLRIFSAVYPDGVEITIPEGGLPGLPRNTVGETREFSVWLEGYDRDGNYITYSDPGFYDDLFQPNEQIVVTLVPAYRAKSIPFPRSQIPVGVNPDNLMLRYGSNSAGWNPYYEGFQIWINPLEDAEWVLYDRSTGFIYPFALPASPAPSPYVGVRIKYAGETVPIRWGENGMIQLYDQFLDGTVYREDVEVSGKTYFTDLEGDGMSIYVANILGKVEMFSIDQDGNRTPVRAVDVDASYWSYVSLPSGYDKIIVTVTGTITYSGGFVIEFIRQPRKVTTTTGPG